MTLFVHPICVLPMKGFQYLPAAQKRWHVTSKIDDKKMQMKVKSTRYFYIAARTWETQKKKLTCISFISLRTWLGIGVVEEALFIF